MPLPIFIKDGSGQGFEARVTTGRALLVSLVAPDLQAIGEPSKFRYFSRLLTNDGKETGSSNMNVDGSVTPQEFFIKADDKFDTRVMGIAITIGDSAVVHDRFGFISGVATGWDLKIDEAGEVTFLIEKAVTGGEVIVQAGFDRAYGSGTDSFELVNFTPGGGDAQTIWIPVADYVPNGLRIGIGTSDKVISVINDDFTGLDTFEVRILGYKHFD